MKTTLPQICRQVAKATRLEEGWIGVEHVIRQVHCYEPLSSKTIAERLGFPIPLVSAIRRELEKAGWLARKGGMVLTEEARRETESIWGPGDCTEVDRASQEGTRLERTNAYLESIAGDRPSAERSWDQSHAIFPTVAARVSTLEVEGSLPGKRLLFLGDDDLTSLASLYWTKIRRGEKALAATRVTVLEIDPRLVEFLDRKAREEELPLKVVQHDLRDPIPESLRSGFDAFFTDPPYTPEGADLFLERGRSALDPDGARRGFLAIPVSPPSLLAATQLALIEKGFVIDFLFPGCNVYRGATMQGGISALYGLTWRGGGKESRAESYLGPLYTAEKKGKRV